MRHKRLIAEVRAARESAGLSQRQLAARLKRSDSYISKIEAGERRLEVCEFLDVCAALSVDAGEILARVKSE